MTTAQAGFALRGRNPDVLTCIANLSNDEVFTPPDFAKRMLDPLADAWAAGHHGADIWADPKVRFLDPFTKSGVFLREITSRLIDGLAQQIPDLEARVDHILTTQVYGIGTTYLTSLLARRSLYCSKVANGPHSVASSFGDERGHIWFERLEHTWVGGTEWVLTADAGGDQVEKFTNGRCKYCGANQKTLDRQKGLETHAYAFIHTDNIQARMAELFGDQMNFDVIIGNPPYQLNDGGGTGSSALPIYQKFVQQAKRLDARFVVMVTPSRWFTGGRGLDDFRDSMLNDMRLREIHDFPDAGDVFPGVEIKGGVSFFVWNRDEPGLCKVATYSNGEVQSSAVRPLLEPGGDNFIRHNELVPILRKVRALAEPTFDGRVSANDPFGFDVREANSYRRVKPKFETKPFSGSVGVYYFGWRKDGLGYIKKSALEKGKELVDRFKLFIPKAWGIGEPQSDWLSPFLGEPGTVSTETYLLVGPFDTEVEARNALSYTQTRFFHAMVAAVKITQNTMKNAYKCVPLQDFTEPWDDEKLANKYGLTEGERRFIETLVRPHGIPNG